MGTILLIFLKYQTNSPDPQRLLKQQADYLLTSF
jgi:hypothetical protein